MKWAPELAEATGAFALVFAACGAIAVWSITGSPDHLGISLVFGLVIGAMIYATGHISGAHFNPAVTFAFAATGHFPWRRVPRYMAAQFTGAILAAGALRLLLPDASTYGETTPHGSITVWTAAAVELLITMLLMFVISGVATDGRATGAMAGNAIGGTVALSALWAGPLTGAGMNPARSLGPALVSLEFEFLWVYLAAPMVGALLGAKLYELTRRGARPTKDNA